MDRLTAFVTIAHAKLRIQIIEKYNLLDGVDMTPKLKGLRQSMDLLRHNLEADSEKLANAIGAADTERTAVFAGAHGILAETGKELDEINDFLADLKEGSNGAPTSGDSSASSGQSPPLDQTLTVGLATDKPENLTVNGVSLKAQ
jgi:hypothetical protein